MELFLHLHLTGHSPLQSLFGWLASKSIGLPLCVPGPWMLYHCFLWEAGNWMTGYLVQQHPVLEKSSLHSYPPIILHSTTQRSLSRLLVRLVPSWAGLISGKNRFFGPSRCFRQNFRAKRVDPKHCTFIRALRAFWKMINMLERIVHWKMKILSFFAHPHVIPILYYLLSFVLKQLFCPYTLLWTLFDFYFMDKNSWNILHTILVCQWRQIIWVNYTFYEYETTHPGSKSISNVFMSCK